MACVASMANASGGLVLVGIADTARTATLTWQTASGELPTFEIKTMIVAPGRRARSHPEADDLPPGHQPAQRLGAFAELLTAAPTWACAPI